MPATLAETNVCWLNTGPSEKYLEVLIRVIAVDVTGKNAVWVIQDRLSISQAMLTRMTALRRSQSNLCLIFETGPDYSDPGET